MAADSHGTERQFHPSTADDGGESTLSGYSREYPTQPERFEEMAQQAPDREGTMTVAQEEETDVYEVLEPTEEMIDEAIEESFPASDPPSYPGSSGECMMPRCEKEAEPQRA